MKNIIYQVRAELDTVIETYDTLEAARIRAAELKAAGSFDIHISSIERIISQPGGKEENNAEGKGGVPG